MPWFCKLRVEAEGSMLWSTGLALKDKTFI